MGAISSIERVLCSPGSIGGGVASCPPLSAIGTSIAPSIAASKIVVYEALKKLAKRGTVRQTGQGQKVARWALVVQEPGLL
jgi:hypothetical protein